MLILAVTASLVALFSVVAWYLASYQAWSGSVGGVMGQMMGGGTANGAMAPMPGYVWAAIVIFAILSVTGGAGLVYYMTYPQIRTVGVQPVQKQTEPVSAPAPRENWAALIRTSKPEEKRVLEVLAAHNGSYLQKFIVKEAGLSRLKTHRIVSRLAERGIITAAKTGNTNEISLASWLTQDAAQPKGQPS